VPSLRNSSPGWLKVATPCTRTRCSQICPGTNCSRLRIGRSGSAEGSAGGGVITSSAVGPGLCSNTSASWPFCVRSEWQTARTRTRASTSGDSPGAAATGISTAKRTPPSAMRMAAARPRKVTARTTPSTSTHWLSSRTLARLSGRTGRAAGSGPGPSTRTRGWSTIGAKAPGELRPSTCTRSPGSSRWMWRQAST
jgi:hypothetical protein